MTTNRPKLWISTTYRSKYSKIVQGHLTIEGATRQEAYSLLKQLAVEAEGAAGEHAKQALSGWVRHTLRTGDYETAYAAKDGMWRGWGVEAWEKDPPESYGRWSKPSR